MSDIIEKLNDKRSEFLNDMAGARDEKSIGEIKRKYLKAFLKDAYSALKRINEVEEKKLVGAALNEFKDFTSNEIRKAESTFGSSRDEFKYDPTIFKRGTELGVYHPLVKFYKKMEKILVRMGFSIVQGPEIELDEYNFSKLNIPAHHPARDMQDTFYVSVPNVLLRSHTSSVQVRTMENASPPIMIISPGTVYRVDDIDPQHTPAFYQVEGLMVGEDVSFANLKFVLITLLKEVFGNSVDVRFRPSYYPYTEPSAAIDISCTECGKKGCRCCGYSGWITVLGSGMVHPNVLEGVGYDSEKYTGLAFGLGLNRLALLYYGLGEIRKLYENDISLWRQL